MNIGCSISGILEVELTSAELSRTLEEINRQGIEIQGLRGKNELTCVFFVRRSCYRTLKRLTQKRGETLTIHNRKGIFWLGKSLLRRPFILAGLLFIFLVSAYLPGRILFVSVEGNTNIPDRLILEAAEKYGVHLGASRREIRNEQIKNGILSDIPQLQWVGVNTSGCVATISIRERGWQEQGTDQNQVTRIIAAQDGYILSGTVERGTAMFREGQTVQKGQLLVSGYVNTDFCIRAVRAEGEIIAQTNRELTAITPDTHLLRTQQKEQKHVISILFRKKRINLWKDSGILPATCGRMYEEYYISLPGGFRLPVALCVDVYTLWDIAESEQAQNGAFNQLRSFSDYYLRTQMIAGFVRNRTENIIHKKDAFVLKGDYVCEEMIGREELEQIGVINGKNN